MKASSAYDAYKTGVPQIQKNILDYIRQGDVTVSKAEFEKAKGGYLEFLKEYKVKIVDKPTRGGGGGQSLVETIVELGGEKHELVSVAREFLKMKKQLNEFLTQKGRTLNTYVKHPAEGDGAAKPKKSKKD